MKYIILLLSFISVFAGYDRDKACRYAQKYAYNYNPNYMDYNSLGGDCANFVSQCLIAGGFNFKQICPDVAYGVGGTVPNEVNLANCLKKNGWTSTTYAPTNFEKGDVVMYSNPGHAVIAVQGYPNILIAAHSENRYGTSVNYRSGGVYYHYNGESSVTPQSPEDDCVKTCNPKRCVLDVAKEVIAGKYGCGEERINKLTAEGCDYRLVQDEVNRILS